MQPVLVSGINGPDYFFIFHTPLQNLTADALTAAFHTEFNYFAAGVGQTTCSIFIEKAYMGVDHKGQGTGFPVGLAKLLDIRAIKGEKIIVQDKHRDILIIALQVFDFLHQLVNREMSDVIQPFETAMQILTVPGDQLMIKTVSAGKGTAAGCHQSDPTVFGIDDTLKIKYLVIFKWQVLQVRQ